MEPLPIALEKLEDAIRSFDYNDVQYVRARVILTNLRPELLDHATVENYLDNYIKITVVDGFKFEIVITHKANIFIAVWAATGTPDEPFYDKAFLGNQFRVTTVIKTLKELKLTPQCGNCDKCSCDTNFIDLVDLYNEKNV
jgi:hypothetical protein